MSRRRGLLVLWGALVLVAWGLARLDPWGDRGMVHAVQQLLFLLGLVLTLVARLLRRELAWRARLKPVLLLALILACLALNFRFTGFSAEMWPRFRPRFRSVPEATIAGTSPATTAPDAAGAGRADEAAEFPQFGGPTRDRVLPGPELARSTDARAQLRWRRGLGAGWSGFVLGGGRAVTMEQDEAGQHVVALDARDGHTLWRTRIEAGFRHALGGDGPRATPALDAGRVFALGAHGTLVALEAASGRELWRHELVREGGLDAAREVELLQYGRASSPLVVDGLVVVPGGGEGPQGAGLVAFEAASGARRWRTPARNPSYATPTSGPLCGREVLLCVNEDTLSIHARADGALLAEHPWPGVSSGAASVSAACIVGPDLVLLTKGYGHGGALVRVVERAGALSCEELWHAPRLLRTKMTDVVVHDGHVYALDDGMLECVELASGAKVWKEGRYGHGQLLAVGGLLLVLGEEGELSAVELASTQPNHVLWRFQALAGKSWAHLALAGDVLYVRNQEEAAAWQLPRAAH